MTTTVDVPTAETRRLALQDELDSERTALERNKLGQFATPPALALDIARYMAQLCRTTSEPIRFAEPAVGSGAFFAALIQAFPRDSIASAVGIEIDPRFAVAARELWSSNGLTVTEGDFTLLKPWEKPDQRPNLILTNPPYVRHHHLSRRQKEYLQPVTAAATGLKVSGLAGLYVYFFLLAGTWLAENGLGAWLIPSEFMDVNYGSVLKRYLTELTTLLSIHRFDPSDVQFGDALVSSAVVVFRKAPPLAGATARFTFGGTVTCPHVSEDVPLSELRHAHKWTSYPRQPSDLGDVTVFGADDGPLLRDFFRVQRGLATGDNSFFIIPREEAIKRRFPEEYLRPILPSARNLRSSVIEADDDGYPLLEPQLALIDCDLPEDELAQRCPSLWS